MAVAAYKPVVGHLERAGVRIVIVGTGQPDQARHFVDNLGFTLPGVMVLDPEKRTHAALGALSASVYESLVTPFRKHLKTFGYRALWEGLRVSLANIGPNGSHGSSWQQGGLFVLSYGDAGAGAGTAKGGGNNKAVSRGALQCDYAWAESYPGDWQPVHRVLADNGIDCGGEEVDIKERMAFVLDQRHVHLQKRAGAGGAGGAAGGWRWWKMAVLVLVLAVLWSLVR